MRTGWLMVLAVLVATTSCGGESDQPDESAGPTLDITGTWWAIELDGEPIEIGQNTAEHPWLTIDDSTIGGNFGCNNSGGNYQMQSTRLVVTDLAGEQELCGIPDGSETMVPTERFLDQMLTSPGTEVVVADGTMTWTGEGHTIAFIAASGEPPPQTTVPPKVFDRLSCAPGVVVESRHPADGMTPQELAADVEPATVRVEEGGPLHWWGYDRQDNVIVGVFLGDAPDPDYQVVTCSK